MSDRVATAFNRSGAARAVAVDISEAFYNVFFTNFKSYGISGQIFVVISSFLSNR